MVFDGDFKPGTFFQLTSNSKYQPNLSCTVVFRTAQPTQRLVITVEKMNIADCPGDTLRILDGTNLLNRDVKQQCGTPAPFTFTVRVLYCPHHRCIFSLYIDDQHASHVYL